jgi:hypothetical protein
VDLYYRATVPAVSSKATVVNPPTAPIIIKPAVKIVPASGPAGTGFELNCTGFSPSGKVSVQVMNLLSLSSTPQADTTGKLTISLESEGWAHGNYICRVTDLSTKIYADGSISILSPPPPPDPCTETARLPLKIVQSGNDECRTPVFLAYYNCLTFTAWGDDRGMLIVTVFKCDGDVKMGTMFLEFHPAYSTFAGRNYSEIVANDELRNVIPGNYYVLVMPQINDGRKWNLTIDSRPWSAY